jgi:DNA-binding CsgD family transcriptional regulator/GAF domain-containing protein
MTTSRFCKEPEVIDARLYELAQTTAGAAYDYLGLPVSESPSEWGVQLDGLRRQLEAELVTEDRSDRVDAVTRQLVEVQRVQCALLDEELSRRLTSLSEIRTALGDLRGLSPTAMIHAAPMVLSKQMSFRRTMISTVRGSLWLPQHLYIDGIEAGSEAQRFQEFVDGAQFQLAIAPLETELVRKRCGALVESPSTDKRTFKEIVEVSQCVSYIAAPIIMQGRVIGMLHADRPDGRGSVTADHLDQLEAFTECLAVAFESAVLEEKSAEQRSEVGNLCARVDELISEVGGADGASASIDARIGGARWRGQQQPDVSALTPREREIMAHVATGATNGQIARCLVISEGTVKSHLKHIAKKLNTPSRAAAVAVFAGASDAGFPR